MFNTSGQQPICTSALPPLLLIGILHEFFHFEPNYFIIRFIFLGVKCKQAKYISLLKHIHLSILACSSSTPIPCIVRFSLNLCTRCNNSIFYFYRLFRQTRDKTRAVYIFRPTCDNYMNSSHKLHSPSSTLSVCYYVAYIKCLGMFMELWSVLKVEITVQES